MKVMLVAPDERAGFGGGQARAGRLLAAALAADARLEHRHVVVPHQHAARSRWQAARMRIGFHARHLWCVLRWRPDVGHYFAPCHPAGFLEKAVLAAIARLFGVCVLVNFRNDLRRYEAAFSPRTRTIYRCGLRRFHGAICQFRALVEPIAALGGFADDHVFVVPNAVAPRAIDPSDADLDRRLAQRRIIFIGSLQRRKGVDTLIEAVALLRDRHGSSDPVDIVGDIQERDTFAALVAQRDACRLQESVVFHGPQFGADKLALLDRAAILVLPSRREGFPNVVLEALQAGLPVVLADSGAAADIAEVFGPAVRVVPADDAVAVADAIEALLGAPAIYRELARRAANDVAAYAPDRIANRFVVAYAALLGVTGRA